MFLNNISKSKNKKSDREWAAHDANFLLVQQSMASSTIIEIHHPPLRPILPILLKTLT